MSTQSKKLGGSARVVFNYLTDEDATMSYYEGFGVAWGKGALSLGLDRGVTREQFTRMFHGQDPHTGEQLAKTSYRKITHEDGTVETVSARTPVIDVVYGTPKSVAELYVKSSPELRKQLDKVLLAAAHAAHNAMEATAKLARLPIKTPTEVGARTTKQQGSQTHRVTAELIALPVVQYTARHTDESEKRGVPDPQIHVHCPIFTLCKVGDRWYTADEFGLKSKANAKHRDSVFMGELARGLEQLGIEVEYRDFARARGGEVRWEVKASDEQLRKYWSTNNERAWKIRKQYEDKHGKPIDEVTLGAILYKTRKSKTAASKRQDARPNWELWRADAVRAGFQINEVRPGRPIEPNAFEAADKLRLRLLSANGLCVDDAVFDEASIRPAIARCAVGLGFSPAELDGCAKAMLAPDGRDLVLVRDGNDSESKLYTTTTMLNAERDIAKEREHKATVWVDITGRAGTGKSTLVKTAVETLRSLVQEHPIRLGEYRDGAPIAEAIKATLGRQDVKLDDEQICGVHAIVTAAEGCEEVICVSMAASTAERTGVKIKADAWGSVESIVSRIDKGIIKPSAKTLVVIEEAGQLDSLRAHKLLKAVGHARIVTLGDTRQLAALGGSGWYADALDKHGSVELTEVRRQKDQRDIDDYALVRDGHAREALESLQSRDRVHISVDNVERMGRVFQDYRRHRESGRLARDVRIVLDASNQEVDLANRFVQRDRLQRQEISPDGLEVESEDQGRRWSLHQNDEVIMLGTVRIKGQDPVKNGSTGRIQNLDLDRNRVQVRLDSGRQVVLPADDKIGLGYAMHIAKMQGGECSIALVVPGSQTSRNAGYTMVTRGIEESHVYVAGPVDALAAAWSKSAEKESARATIARIREEQALEPLPPGRSDELHLADIEVPPLPDLEDLTPLQRDDLDVFVPERMEPESLDQALETEGRDMDTGLS